MDKYNFKWSDSANPSVGKQHLSNIFFFFSFFFSWEKKITHTERLFSHHKDRTANRENCGLNPKKKKQNKKTMSTDVSLCVCVNSHLIQEENENNAKARVRSSSSNMDVFTLGSQYHTNMFFLNVLICTAKATADPIQLEYLLIRSGGGRSLITHEEIFNCTEVPPKLRERKKRRKTLPQQSNSQMNSPRFGPDYFNKTRLICSLNWDRCSGRLLCRAEEQQRLLYTEKHG